MPNDEKAKVASDALVALLQQLTATNGPTLTQTQWDKLNVGIEYAGRAITLPADPGRMPTELAIEALQRKLDDDEQEFNVHEIIDAEPHDAAVAFTKAMARLYGWASPQTVMTFFGPEPPQMLSVKTGPGVDDVMQCPLGQFKLPGVNERINTMFHMMRGRNPRAVFLIYGEVRKRNRHLILELANEARKIVAAESIYRSKPVRLAVDDDGDPMTNEAPEFMDVRDVSESQIVFDSEIADSIGVNVLTPIRATAACRAARIPLKRGVLLEGPYGTGKTLVARFVAHECERNGWTFLLLDNVAGLRHALEFAKRYSPCVVFAEDIDRVAAERDDACNDLVNTMDGVLSKDAEIMVILTTNHAEKLSPVILRPGRLDAVISLRAPGPKAAQRLIQYYAGDNLGSKANLAAAGLELAGQIPASIREAVERAKLAMIGRGAEKLEGGDLVLAAQTMKAHMDLLRRRTEVQPESDADALARILPRIVKNGDGSRLGEIAAMVAPVPQMNETLGSLNERIATVMRKMR